MMLIAYSRLLQSTCCTEPWDKPPFTHHHVQGSISAVNCGPEPCQRDPALTFPVSCPCLQVLIIWKLSFRSCAVWVHVYALDDHYLRVIKNLTLSSLKWSLHKRNYYHTNSERSEVLTRVLVALAWFPKFLNSRSLPEATHIAQLAVQYG